MTDGIDTFDKILTAGLLAMKALGIAGTEAYCRHYNPPKKRIVGYQTTHRIILDLIQVGSCKIFLGECPECGQIFYHYGGENGEDM